MKFYLKFCALVILWVSINSKQVNATAIDNRIEKSGCNGNDTRLQEDDYYCPHGCNCIENIHVKCALAKLTEVPQYLPKNAMILDLSYNHIRDLHAGDFSNSVNSIEINLNENKLAKLEKVVFAGLTCLERLLLAHNKFTSLVPDVFSLAFNLKFLDLSDNSIMLPKSGALLIQPSLRVLYCNKCIWANAYDGTFDNLSSLTTLELGENTLNTKMKTPVLLPLQNLTTLKLAKFEPNGTTELCVVLKSLEIIKFPYIDFSCEKIIAGKNFHEIAIGLADAAVSTKNPNKEIPNKIDWLETVEDASDNETIISVVGTSSDIELNGGKNPDKGVVMYIILALAIIGIIITLSFRKDIAVSCFSKRNPAVDLA